jgi:hypothetical protein
MNNMRAGAIRGLGKFCLGLAAVCGLPLQAAAADRANFAREHASPETRHIADWVVHSRDNREGGHQAGNSDSSDNRSLPFAIVDKKEAKVFVFDADGRLRGAAPALLGMTRGDDSVAGIGDRDLENIPPEQRTTPAGRFVAAISRDIHGDDLLMIDYGLNVAMHRVITTNPKERRLQRLATPTPLDNRISWGCINVPAKFYDNVVRPAFAGTRGIVYVLPETKPASKVFASYDVQEHERTKTASQSEPERPQHAALPIVSAAASGR